MKKALIIANMLFASATVFGMEYSQTDTETAIENSLKTLQLDENRRKAFEKSQLEEALKRSIEDQAANEKKVVIKFDIGFSNVLNANTVKDLSKTSYLINPGKYTFHTFEILENKNYTFTKRDHGASFNGFGNQCAILALNVDEPTMKRLQQLKITRNTKGTILCTSEESDLEGTITFDEYLEPRGGLGSDQAIIWEKIAEIIKHRIDIFEFPNEGKDAMGVYHAGGQLSMISSYGTEFNDVKRLHLESDPRGKGGHYTELRIFDKDGSQVK